MAVTSRKTKMNSTVSVPEAIAITIVLGIIVAVLSALPYLLPI